MDTMKILLGATVALLLAALVMSWNGMRTASANAPQSELAKINQQIEEIRIEKAKLELEMQRQQLQDLTILQPAQVVASDSEALRAQLAAKEEELRAIEDQKSRAERDAQTYKDEAGFVGQQVLERNDNELRRARLIRDALLLARVQEYVNDDEYGGFATLELIMPENVQPGMVLSIRRNTGLLGQLKISSIEGTEAVANLMPGFGSVMPEAGDELILAPD